MDHITHEMRLAKTRYDPGMGVEIPHNSNIANAMFGFREMEAELVTYHSIDDIYETNYQKSSLKRRKLPIFP